MRWLPVEFTPLSKTHEILANKFCRFSYENTKNILAKVLKISSKHVIGCIIKANEIIFLIQKINRNEASRVNKIKKSRFKLKQLSEETHRNWTNWIGVNSKFHKWMFHQILFTVLCLM